VFDDSVDLDEAFVMSEEDIPAAKRGFYHNFKQFAIVSKEKENI
jgi:hypothetical protein